jgi:hypothetical protein
LIERIRTLIERRGFPRLQMMLLVSLTGGAGFLCSYALLTLAGWAMSLYAPEARSLGEVLARVTGTPK